MVYVSASKWEVYTIMEKLQYFYAILGLLQKYFGQSILAKNTGYCIIRYRNIAKQLWQTEGIL